MPDEIDTTETAAIFWRNFLQAAAPLLAGIDPDSASELRKATMAGAKTDAEIVAMGESLAVGVLGPLASTIGRLVHVADSARRDQGLAEQYPGDLGGHVPDEEVDDTQINLGRITHREAYILYDAVSSLPGVTELSANGSMAVAGLRQRLWSLIIGAGLDAPLRLDRHGKAGEVE